MSDLPKTRVSLILRLRDDRDAQAWQEFAEIYQPLIFRIARQRGLQSADAHDLVQESMTRIARSIQHWDPDSRLGTFRGWISRIARNLIIDFLRNKNRLPRTGDPSDDVHRLIEQVPDRSMESQLFDREQEQQVFSWAASQVKRHFSDTTWQAFCLTSVAQQSVDLVAERLQLSRGAVYIARSRVMARLKAVVAKTQFESQF